MRRSLEIALAVALLLVLVLAVAGCGCGSTQGGGSSVSGSLATTTTTEREIDVEGLALEPGEGLADAEERLVEVLGLQPDDLRVSDLTPGSRGADTVLIWTAGKAEVDSASGRIFLLSMNRPEVDPGRSFLSDVQLKHAAGKIPGLLGWGDGMLSGMGFRQDQPGIVSTEAGLFTLVWVQYAGERTDTDGRVEVHVDARSGELTGFSVSLASDSPEVEGALGASDALDIAEMHIFLNTKTPVIPLMGDGSLILINRQLSQELQVVKDRKITKDKPVLVWVISLSGTVENTTVGGTVYVDAMTGEVLSYQPLLEE